MADNKPECVNTCTINDCVAIGPCHPRWFETHMPCWVCNTDKQEDRADLMWHEESEMYFHGICILKRELDNMSHTNFGDAVRYHILAQAIRKRRRVLMVKEAYAC